MINSEKTLRTVYCDLPSENASYNKKSLLFICVLLLSDFSHEGVGQSEEGLWGSYSFIHILPAPRTMVIGCIE